MALQRVSLMTFRGTRSGPSCENRHIKSSPFSPNPWTQRAIPPRSTGSLSSIDSRSFYATVEWTRWQTSQLWPSTCTTILCYYNNIQALHSTPLLHLGPPSDYATHFFPRPGYPRPRGPDWGRIWGHQFGLLPVMCGGGGGGTTVGKCIPDITCAGHQGIWLKCMKTWREDKTWTVAIGG